MYSIVTKDSRRTIFSDAAKARRRMEIMRFVASVLALLCLVVIAMAAIALMEPGITIMYRDRVVLVAGATVLVLLILLFAIFSGD